MVTNKFQLISSDGIVKDTSDSFPSGPELLAAGASQGVTYPTEHYGNRFSYKKGRRISASSSVNSIDVRNEWKLYLDISANSVSADFVIGETIYQPRPSHPQGDDFTATVCYWDSTKKILGVYDAGPTSGSDTGPTGPNGSTGATGATSGHSGGQVSGAAARWEVFRVEQIIGVQEFKERVWMEHWGSCGDTSGGSELIPYGSAGGSISPPQNKVNDYSILYNMIAANHATRTIADHDFISSISIYDINGNGYTLSATGGGSGSRANHGISAESEFNDFYYNYTYKNFLVQQSMEYYRSLYADLDSVYKINTTRGL